MISKAVGRAIMEIALGDNKTDLLKELSTLDPEDLAHLRAVTARLGIEASRIYLIKTRGKS